MTSPGPLPVIDAERTAAQLRGKLNGLGSELDEWRAAATDPDKSLRRHHTQIEAVTGTLQEAAAGFTATLADPDQGLWILDRAGHLDRQIMDLHRLWGFFRAKFALRYVPWLEAPLMTADDLAWACYSPAQRFIAPGRRREPPLVYFTGGTSPFLLPRGTPYLVEPLPDGSMREPEFDEAVRLIPVALIGLPWFQVDHLPDAPLIAHEAGHAVEQDLGLGTQVQALIESAVPAERSPAWGAWSTEVFADIYGTLCCGSGFVRALLALLADHPRDVAGEVRIAGAWGSYPTRTLRVLLAAAVLAKLGVEPADGSVAEAWLGTYSARPLKDFEDDVARVAAAVMDGPYEALGCAGLTAIVRYEDNDERAVSALAGKLLAGVQISTDNVRHITAAARLAYDRDRGRYARRNAAKIARDKVASIPFNGIRAAGGAETPPASVREGRDQLAGRALSELMGRAAGRGESGRS